MRQTGAPRATTGSDDAEKIRRKEALEMRTLHLATAVTALLLLNGGLGYGQEFRYSLDYRPAVRALSNADLERLKTTFSTFGTDLAGPQLHSRVHNAFHFTYFNRLARSRFVVEPPPQLIVDKILVLFHLNRSIRDSIAQGRREILAGDMTECRRLAQGVSEAARSLSGTFTSHFVTVRHGDYSFDLPSLDSDRDRFIHYLLNAERANNLISTNLLDYFLRQEPAVVDMTEFDNPSLKTLTLALVRMEELFLLEGSWRR